MEGGSLPPFAELVLGCPAGPGNAELKSKTSAKNCDSARNAVGLVLGQDRLPPAFLRISTVT
jgi:hypothetical protein